jgi:hypothetical protein
LDRFLDFDLDGDASKTPTEDSWLTIGDEMLRDTIIAHPDRFFTVRLAKFESQWHIQRDSKPGGQAQAVNFYPALEALGYLHYQAGLTGLRMFEMSPTEIRSLIWSRFRWAEDFSPRIIVVFAGDDDFYHGRCRGQGPTESQARAFFQDVMTWCTELASLVGCPVGYAGVLPSQASPAHPLTRTQLARSLHTLLLAEAERRPYTKRAKGAFAVTTPPVSLAQVTVAGMPTIVARWTIVRNYANGVGFAFRERCKSPFSESSKVSDTGIGRYSDTGS